MCGWSACGSKTLGFLTLGASGELRLCQAALPGPPEVHGLLGLGFVGFRVCWV